LDGTEIHAAIEHFSTVTTQIIAATLHSIQEGIQSANLKCGSSFKLSPEKPLRFQLQVPAQWDDENSVTSIDFEVLPH
jgi:hypothetical protein